MYGSFNNFTPSTALQLGGSGGTRYGYKYFTAGTQIKFLSSNTDNATVYGFGQGEEIVPNGTAYTIPSSGFYSIYVNIGGNDAYGYITQVAPYVPLIDNNTWTDFTFNPTYNVATNQFTFSLTGITNTYTHLKMRLPMASGSFLEYGDYLSDGTLDPEGTSIPFPGVNATPKNYTFKATINFNGSATYTLTTP